MVNVKEEIDLEDFLEVSPTTENMYPILQEPAGTKEAHVHADREACNADVIQDWREEDTRRSDEEKPFSSGSTGGEADKHLKSKLFL